ncbi:MAG: AI-2E family transporter [Betaproteobacteria bacterium]|nr:AI-2E family transporter [Betaproteobacteria bacterium]
MDSTRFEQYARTASISLLVIGCFFVIRPFLAALLFAAVLCLSTWPAFRWLKDRLGGRTTLTALLFVLAMLMAIALPVALAGVSLATHSTQAIDAVRGFVDRGPFELPAWLTGLPLVGASVDEYWHRLVGDRSEIVALARRLAEPAKGLLLGAGSAAGEGLLSILIAIFMAFFFYRDGEAAGLMIRNGMARIAGGEKGAAVIETAQNAVKGVVYGLIGTALAQAAVALVGFVIAGVPAVVALSALTFVLSFIPMGPAIIWGGAAAWLYSNGESGWAMFMLAYGALVISSVDNVIKPILMSRAGGLSMLLVVLGVFGGAVAFGFIGIFVGPALLAVAWSLLTAWLKAQDLKKPA